MSTMYATFVDGAMANRAVGALIDHGALRETISLVATKDHQHYWMPEEQGDGTVTTTSGRDAAVGASKGAGIGLAVGVIAGLACLTIPGFGIVVGGGALATALAAATGTMAAGAVAGAVEGYLVDQGVPGDIAIDYKEALENGSGLLAITLPSGTVDSLAARDILNKYHTTQIYFRANGLE